MQPLWRFACRGRGQHHVQSAEQAVEFLAAGGGKVIGGDELLRRDALAVEGPVGEILMQRRPMDQMLAQNFRSGRQGNCLKEYWAIGL
jgi:hypothetical protein